MPRGLGHLVTARLLAQDHARTPAVISSKGASACSSGEAMGSGASPVSRTLRAVYRGAIRCSILSQIGRQCSHRCGGCRSHAVISKRLPSRRYEHPPHGQQPRPSCVISATRQSGQNPSATSARVRFTARQLARLPALQEILLISRRRLVLHGLLKSRHHEGRHLRLFAFFEQLPDAEDLKLRVVAVPDL